MNGLRDIELLSSYLDGQLGPSDSTRLESRLNSDPELAAAFNDLRAARGILRKLPARHAPRNFTLTRKMVGTKPPMPRSYSFFRFSSAFATVLLVITFAFNIIGSRISFGAAAPAYGYENPGMGGGGGGPDTALQAIATEAPAAAEEPALELAPLPTEVVPPAAADSSREMETATPLATTSPKDVVTPAVVQDQAERLNTSFFAAFWKMGLLIVSILCAAIAFAMNRSAKRKWR